MIELNDGLPDEEENLRRKEKKEKQKSKLTEALEEISASASDSSKKRSEGEVRTPRRRGEVSSVAFRCPWNRHPWLVKIQESWRATLMIVQARGDAAGGGRFLSAFWEKVLGSAVARAHRVAFTDRARHPELIRCKPVRQPSYI